MSMSLEKKIKTIRSVERSNSADQQLFASRESLPSASGSSFRRSPMIDRPSQDAASLIVPAGLGFGEVTGEASFREPEELPTLAELQTAAQDSVFDENLQPRRLSSILSSKYNICVFIRHFRCGLCQDFLIYLAAQDRLKPDVLRRAGAKLLVIGCGDPAFIKAYKGVVNLDCEVYANPSGSLYKTLGMTFEKGVNLQTNNFYTGSFASMILHSIARGLRLKIFGFAGNTQQLGGEFVFALNATGCLYAHRMRNSSDHSQPSEILDCCGASFFAI